MASSGNLAAHITEQNAFFRERKEDAMLAIIATLMLERDNAACTLTDIEGKFSQTHGFGFVHSDRSATIVLNIAKKLQDKGYIHIAEGGDSGIHKRRSKTCHHTHTFTLLAKGLDHYNLRVMSDLGTFLAAKQIGFELPPAIAMAEIKPCGRTATTVIE